MVGKVGLHAQDLGFFRPNQGSITEPSKNPITSQRSMAPFRDRQAAAA
jgi:hypothetical protein